jgi:plasmid stabilization system protein ParE
MNTKNKITISYSKQSLENAKEIVRYLKRKFSKKEVDQFYRLLTEFEKIISVYPTLYPESKKYRIRQAILSKVLTVYFTFNDQKILIVAIVDNRWDKHRVTGM